MSVAASKQHTHLQVPAQEVRYLDVGVGDREPPQGVAAVLRLPAHGRGRWPQDQPDPPQVLPETNRCFIVRLIERLID